MRKSLLLSFALLLPLLPTSAQAETCPQGKTVTMYTDGNCCWPGQGWSGSECVGPPTACPDGMRADGNRCTDGLVACPEGRQVMFDEQTCCWTGQTLTPQGCYGTPSSCPEGTTAGADGCEKPHHSPTKVPLLPEMEALCERVTAAGTTLPAEPTAEDIFIRSIATQGYDKLCGLSGGYYEKQQVQSETKGVTTTYTNEGWYAPPNLSLRIGPSYVRFNNGIVSALLGDSGLTMTVSDSGWWGAYPNALGPLTDSWVAEYTRSAPERTSHEGRDVWLVSDVHREYNSKTHSYFASDTGLPVYSTRRAASGKYSSKSDWHLSGGWHDRGGGCSFRERGTDKAGKG